MFSMNHKFTIVTVTYNAVDLIERTIQSVAKQSYRNIEYIIIDGASTDGTSDIVRKYNNKIHCWVSEPDGGIYEAMNKGIDKANGEWINFMNAGDTFSDDEVIMKLSQYIKSDSEIVYGDRYYIRNGKKTYQKAKPIETIFKRMPFGHQSTFFRSSVLNRNPFNETYKFTADYELLIKLYTEKYNFQYVNFPICNFISGGKSESGIRPYLEALKILFEYCDDREIIKQNTYFKAFYKSSQKLLNESIGK